MTTRFRVLLVLLVLLGVLASSYAYADAARTQATHRRVAHAAMGGYALSWDVAAGGGTTMTSGSFTLHSTAGQSAVGQMSSAGYQVRSGYWQSFLQRVQEYLLYLPFVSKGP